MKNLFCFLAALVFSAGAFCNPADSAKKAKIYHINYPVTGIIIAGGTVSDFFAIKRIKAKPDISDEELLFLNSKSQRDLINPFDRWALRQNASEYKQYKKISDYGLSSIVLLPCVLIFDKDIRRNWGDILLMYTEGHIITFTFYNYSFIGPTFQNQFRPIAYYPEIPDDDRKNGNNRNSFYSGHVASCAYSTFFMAKVYSDYHPDLGAAKYLWYIAAAIPPVLMSYGRMKALDHFPSDNAVGLVLGAALGIIIPELHKYPCNKNLAMGMFTSPEGMGLSVRWKLPDLHLLALGK